MQDPRSGFLRVLLIASGTRHCRNSWTTRRHRVRSGVLGELSASPGGSDIFFLNEVETVSSDGEGWRQPSLTCALSPRSGVLSVRLALATSHAKRIAPPLEIHSSASLASSRSRRQGWVVLAVRKPGRDHRVPVLVDAGGVAGGGQHAADAGLEVLVLGLDDEHGLGPAAGALGQVGVVLGEEPDLAARRARRKRSSAGSAGGCPSGPACRTACGPVPSRGAFRRRPCRWDRCSWRFFLLAGEEEEPPCP